MIIGTNEFEKIRENIYRYSGMQIGRDRDYFLESRILGRMEELRLERFTDYFRFLMFDFTGEELRQLINCTTVNETFFFRDYTQLTDLAEKVIPLILEQKKKKGDRVLRVLSMGCSTGEEIYSLAIIIREMVDNLDEWDVRLDGFDINSDILEVAREANYGPRSVRDVPISFRIKYFQNQGENVVVNPIIRNMVRFERGNALDREYMKKWGDVDIVFFRNVLIYFDDDSRKKALATAADCMKPGGFIFLGYAENIGRYTAAFEIVRIGSAIMYRKPDGETITTNGLT